MLEFDDDAPGRIKIIRIKLGCFSRLIKFVTLKFKTGN